MRFPRRPPLGRWVNNDGPRLCRVPAFGCAFCKRWVGMVRPRKASFGRSRYTPEEQNGGEVG